MIFFRDLHRIKQLHISRISTIESKFLDLHQKNAVFGLWNNEYPVQLTFSDASEFNVYLDALKDQRHVLLAEDEITSGWAFSFVRDSERWFAMILHKRMQGKGHGSRLLSQLLETESKLCGWVIDHNNYVKKNGEPYRTPLAFYLKNGFNTVTSPRLEAPEISAVKIEWQKQKTHPSLI